MADDVQMGYVLDYTPAGNVAAGDVVVVGALVGVAPRPIAAGVTGALAVEGVFALPCPTGATGAQGSAISWVAASGIAHPSTGTVAGKLAKARAATDTVVHVILNK